MQKESPLFSIESLRGGILILIRWVIFYPIVFLTYRVRGWSRSPFMLQPELMQKPGVLVSNYGNYLYDDLIGLMLPPVVPFVFVRDAACRRFPFLRTWLKTFRCIPFIRSKDQRYSEEERKTSNERTLSYVAGLLRQGHWLSVFPESLPGHRSQILKPLRPGAAYIALLAEDLSGWSLDSRIYVYGTNYENKRAARSQLYIRWATPIEVSKYKKTYLENPRQAELSLMEEIEKALHSVVLEAPAVGMIEDSHRLAYQRKASSFVGVESALHEVTLSKTGPSEMRKIVCGRSGESVVYQMLGFLFLGLGWLLGWPFRTFGKLCSTDASQEMTFQSILWLLVFLIGAGIGQWHWVLIQVLATWLGLEIWLWAWRRGIV